MNVKTDSVIINGGKKLRGRVSVQGSKNATLPILAASVLIPGKITLYNVPDIVDVHAMLEILKYLGAEYTFKHNVIHIDNSKLENKIITEEFTNRLRASSLFVGPLLARFGESVVGMPGGCSIGPRPLNYHIEGLEHLNAEISVESGLMNAKTKGIRGMYSLEYPSVGATENLINASIFAKGTVLLHNIAMEPEVMTLIHFLRKMGADINVRNNMVSIKGVKKLYGGEFTIPPDRIEAGTILIAGFATKGEVTVKNVNPRELQSVIQKLKDMGALIRLRKNEITVKYQGIFKGTNIRTGVYPGFPTDLQAPFSVLLTRSNSPSVITESVFANRFRHLDELQKMGAAINIENNMAIIYPSKLSACTIRGYDLRGAAAMVIAGLIAKGATKVEGLNYMHRGYEALVEKLQFLGAELYYIEDKETLFNSVQELAI